MIHYLYEIIGIFFAYFAEVFYCIRDCILPPKENAVLFVAHPDDDALFFHSFIKEYKPYVVLITTGGVLKRVFPFYKAMKYYGVRFRTFHFQSKAIEKELIISQKVNRILSKGSFIICATHNAQGEYGHEMHKCVHRCVVRNWKGELLFVPYGNDEIVNYPLERNVYLEKEMVLKRYYKREYPVLKTHIIWIKCEALKTINNANLKEVIRYDVSENRGNHTSI